MTDIFNPESYTYPYQRSGGTPSSINNKVEANIPIRRRKWQTSPVVITLNIRNVKSKVKSTLDLIKSYGGDTAFYFKDIYDEAIEEEILGTGNGSRTIFYFDNKYPISGTVTIYDSTAEVDSSDYTIDYDNGKITFDTPPLDTHIITADYDFYRLMYFNVEEDPTKTINISNTDLNIWELSITMIESII